MNAFFGLMLDNISDMILMAALLVGAFGFPSEFVLTRMIPGTAVGVMVGDLVYTILAIRLMRRLGRAEVTAMPLGLDTPSTFGAVLLIIGPTFLKAKERGLSVEDAASHAWYLAIAVLLASGLFKLACSFASGWIRRALPRAGLLGSLTAIALVIISFLPLVDVAAHPIVGMTALGIILVSLTARWELPFKLPGALGAVLVGCWMYYLLKFFGLGLAPEVGAADPTWRLRPALPLPIVDWFAWFQGNWRELVDALPVAIPLALATIVGGIDCSESAAAAGDEYSTGQIVAIDGFATLVGGLFGGVIQSTPYIGHPAYKAMGARAGYTFATALFVGGAGVFGYFDWIFQLLPKAAVFPILIFVGLEITSQSFLATHRRHYPAVAFACVPALAYLASIALNNVLPESKPFTEFREGTQHWMQTVFILASGFIVTSLLWGAMLAHAIDGKARAAAGCLILAAVFSLFGVIHSGLPGSPILPPHEAISRLKEAGRLEASRSQTPYHWAAAYGVLAVVLLGIGRWGTVTEDSRNDEPIPI